MRAFHLLKVFIKGFRGAFFFTISILILEFFFDLIAIFSVAPVFDFLVYENAEKMSVITKKFAGFVSSVGLTPSLTTFLGVFLGFQVLKNSIYILVRYSIIKIHFDVKRNLMLGVLEDIFKARWYFFTQAGHGMMLNTFNREMSVMAEAFYNMGLLFASILRFIVFIAVPFFISWQASSVCLIVATLCGLPLMKLSKINYTLGIQCTSTANHLMAMLNECLVGSKVILGYGLQNKSIKLVEAAFDKNRTAMLKSKTIMDATPLVYEPFGILAVFVTVVMAKKFGISVSEIAVMIWSFMKAMPLIGFLVERKNSLENFYPSYEQIVTLQKKAQDEKQKTGEKVFEGFNKEITFRSVTFSYPGHPPVLKDIDISIPKGHMIGIVGESGAGKSTFADMLLGFNSSTKGEILVDGTPLHEFDITTYRNRIGYVPQESILFDMSIRDNLLWAFESASEEEILEACRLANADKFIYELPDKLDTLVGDRGVRLSGGQCQRISLARAILRKPDILVLDEATSALDTQSEGLIQAAIEEIAHKTTILVIAHRLSTIRKANTIYVLEKGEVIEKGGYTDLVEQNGIFRNMVQMQALSGE